MRANRLNTRPPRRTPARGPAAHDVRLDRLHQAEALGALLPPLLIRIERVAASMSHGVHGRRRVGPGETFWQFRGYQQGESTRRIDWRRSAKSHRLFIRQTEWEAAQSVWLWRDGSASMDYRSSERWPTKIERAELLLMAIASLLARGGERLALLHDETTPAPGRAALRRLATTLALAAAEHESLPQPKPLPRYSTLVMIGDFLAPLAHIKETLAAFAGWGVVGHLVQIMDPAEETLPFAGRIRFEGAEHEGSALIGRVEDVRADYQAAVVRHRQELKNLTRSLGWTFTLHHTDRPPQPALLALHLALSSGGR